MWPIVLLRNRPTVRPYPAQAITLHMSRSPGLVQLLRSYITSEQGHGICIAVAEVELGVLFNVSCSVLYLNIVRIILVSNEF